MHIAITGTIGSGKSTVSALLREWGYPVFDADLWAKTHYTDAEVQAALIQRFGASIYIEGELDTAALATIIFHPDGEADRRYVEGLIHPLVYADLMRLAKESGAPIVFSEVPLLFETHGEVHFDRVLLVTCDETIAQQRLIHQRHMTPQRIALRRIHQLDEGYKRAHADDIIENNGDRTTLMRQVAAYSDKIKAIHAQNS
jgi:dephospho-CoA kinase